MIIENEERSTVVPYYSYWILTRYVRYKYVLYKIEVFYKLPVVVRVPGIIPGIIQ